METTTSDKIHNADQAVKRTGLELKQAVERMEFEFANDSSTQSRSDAKAEVETKQAAYWDACKQYTALTGYEF